MEAEGDLPNLDIDGPRSATEAAPAFLLNSAFLFSLRFFCTLMSDSMSNGDLWFSRFIVGAQKYPLKPLRQSTALPITRMDLPLIFSALPHIHTLSILVFPILRQRLHRLEGGEDVLVELADQVTLGVMLK